MPDNGSTLRSRPTTVIGEHLYPVPIAGGASAGWGPGEPAVGRPDRSIQVFSPFSRRTGPPRREHADISGPDPSPPIRPASAPGGCLPQGGSIPVSLRRCLRPAVPWAWSSGHLIAPGDGGLASPRHARRSRSASRAPPRGRGRPQPLRAAPIRPVAPAATEVPELQNRFPRAADRPLRDRPSGPPPSSGNWRRARFAVYLSVPARTGIERRRE